MIRSFLPAILLVAMGTRAGTVERGQLDSSPTLFTVMAAINAAGYDADLASPNNHPLRAAVRKALAQKDIPCLPELKKFYQDHKKRTPTADFSQYLSFALAMDGSPDFTFKGRGIEIPPDVIEMEALSPLLVRFSQEAGIEDLWNRSQAALDQAIERYHGPVSRSILETNAYLRNVTSGYLGRRFQIYLDLLAAPNQIQARSYGDNYYVVLTPSLEPQVADVRHGYLHYLLDPLSFKYGEVVQRKRALVDFAQAAPALDESFKNDFSLLLTESLIKVIEARLDKKPERVPQALAEGFVLAPYFAEQMPVYEKQEQAFSLYYTDLIKAIDLKREAARLSNVQFAKDTAVRVAKTAPAPPPPPVTGTAKTLEDAEQAYTARDLETAKKLYAGVLQRTEDKPMHAQAYYGLARISALQRDPETAERLFQKALESSPEPQIRAWCHVYLARLADAAGERAQALQHYQEALKVEGASPGARQAAEQGTKQSFSTKN